MNEIRRAPVIWSAGEDQDGPRFHSARRVLGPVLGGGLRRGMECLGHEVNDIDHGDRTRTKRALEMSGKVDFLMTPPPSS